MIKLQTPDGNAWGRVVVTVDDDRSFWRRVFGTRPTPTVILGVVNTPEPKYRYSKDELALISKWYAFCTTVASADQMGEADARLIDKLHVDFARRK